MSTPSQRPDLDRTLGDWPRGFGGELNAFCRGSLMAIYIYAQNRCAKSSKSLRPPTQNERPGKGRPAHYDGRRNPGTLG